MNQSKSWGYLECYRFYETGSKHVINATKENCRMQKYSFLFPTFKGNPHHLFKYPNTNDTAVFQNNKLVYFEKCSTKLTSQQTLYLDSIFREISVHINTMAHSIQTLSQNRYFQWCSLMNKYNAKLAGMTHCKQGFQQQRSSESLRHYHQEESSGPATQAWFG